MQDGTGMFEVGDIVVFGRAQGEKTIGKVVGQTRTGKLKIQQMEERGTGRNYKPGEVWTVPPGLVQLAASDAVAGRAVAAEETRIFAVGDRVLVADSERALIGTVVRVNRKTLTIDGDDGASYRVPPELVRLAVREDTDDVDPNWLEPDSTEDPGFVLQAIEHPPERAGLAFTVSARELLAERSWLEVQQLLVDAMLAFNRVTTFDISVWLDRMDGLNRFNQPDTLVAVWFAFPFRNCSEDDITPIYEGLKASGVHFTAEGIQPIIDPAFPSLLVLRPDEVYQVWLHQEPAPVAMGLALEEDGEPCVFGPELDDTNADDFLPGVRHTVLVDPAGTVERT